MQDGEAGQPVGTGEGEETTGDREDVTNEESVISERILQRGRAKRPNGPRSLAGVSSSLVGAEGASASETELAYAAGEGADTLRVRNGDTVVQGVHPAFVASSSSPPPSASKYSQPDSEPTSTPISTHSPSQPSPTPSSPLHTTPPSSAPATEGTTSAPESTLSANTKAGSTPTPAAPELDQYILGSVDRVASVTHGFPMEVDGDDRGLGGDAPGGGNIVTKGSPLSGSRLRTASCGQALKRKR